MTVYARKDAQLIMKNLLFAESMLFAAWFGELKPDWSKMLFGSWDLVSEPIELLHAYIQR